ncbi:MAG: sulfotransferase [Pseudomonadota bacterium]
MRRLAELFGKSTKNTPAVHHDRSNKKGPDFICIGMQKAATRTLHDILSLEDGFWMPLVKEFHHFDNGDIPRRHKNQHHHLEALEKGGQVLARLNERRAKFDKRPLDVLDLEFLNASKTYLDGGMTDALYLDLFSMCPEGDWVGDVTPGYSSLDVETAKHTKAIVPDAKIVLILRDPVARAWSHINMTVRKLLQVDKAKFDAAEAQKISDYIREEKYVDWYVQKAVRKAFPTQIYDVWTSAYGVENVLVYSFEDITRRPNGSVLALRAFLKGEATDIMPTIEDDMAEKAVEAPNRKANAPRVEMTDEYRDKLIEMFRPELSVAQSVFGAKAAGWAEKYGISVSD